VILIIVVGVIGWYLTRDDAEQQKAERPSLIYNRLWVDKKPKLSKDYVHALLVMEQMPVGIFQRASAYRFEAERFDRRIKKSTIEIWFPQTEKEARVRFQISACRELDPYDLCLDLDKNPMGGPTRFYGMRQPKRAGTKHKALRRDLTEQLAN
jgi:hypothetical protein